jgi:hypothetical protein
MGIFFVPHQPVVPELNDTIRVALLVDPTTLTNVEREAAQRTLEGINPPDIAAAHEAIRALGTRSCREIRLEWKTRRLPVSHK